jgi:uncharacterized damage-inducible protein DinB
MRDHFMLMWRYTRWANDRVLAAAIAEGGAENRGTLSHIAAAQSIWLARVAPGYSATFGLFEDLDLDTCAAELLRGVAGWIQYLEGVSDDQFAGYVDYANLRGEAQRNVLRDIVTQVINHGTHHRGQIATRLRQAGHTPPVTDYIAWVREQGAA